jgi:hypothetical protein
MANWDGGKLTRYTEDCEWFARFMRWLKDWMQR